MGEIAVLSFVFSAFLVGLSATLPPGPIFTMAVAESAKRGFMGGFMVIVGHAIVEVIVVIALILGFGIFLGSDSAKVLISVLGGFTLVLMGFNVVGGAYKAVLPVPGKGTPDKHASYRPLIGGIVAAVAKPYFIIW